jgi:3-deoxy-D-manno-octulosonate 8-phosphate phosphatase (KDO 8-P phosphatase)
LITLAEPTNGSWQRAQQIQLILMDCDGVLTDGRIIPLPDGSEIKHFHAADGQGIKLAKQAGLLIGIVSGRQSAVLQRRAQENHYDFLYQAVENKLAVCQELLTAQQITWSKVAFIGDDLPDIAPMSQAGLAIAVANAVSEVRQVAHFTTQQRGGFGAVREAIELILKAQGKWEQLIAYYSESHASNR